MSDNKNSSFGNYVMGTLAVSFLSTCLVLGIREKFTGKAAPQAAANTNVVNNLHIPTETNVPAPQ